MDLSLTENQELLRNTAQDFMERECPKDALLEMDLSDTGFTPELWQRASEIGWLSMVVPEEYGGAGSSLTDAAVVFEQLGRGPLAGPFFSSGILSSLIVLEAGTADDRARYLPGMAAGQDIVTLAFTEPDFGWTSDSVQMRAYRKNGGLVLNGTKLFVHDALSANKFICAVRTEEHEGISLLMVDSHTPGISTRLLPGFIGQVGEVTFDSVEVPETAVLGEVGSGWHALQAAFEKAIPILCAYKVGGAQAVFDMSLEYSRTREQFGTPIGRFQRVQDHVINIVNQLDAARWTTYEALWKLDSGRPVESSVHLAKAVASEGYYQACNGAHEVHAGVGVSREYGLTLHTKMSRTLYHYLGDPKFHRRRIAATLEL